MIFRRLGLAAIMVKGNSRPPACRQEVNRPKPSKSEQTDGPWPHRLAWILACATFVLIWVGGNVTTYEAGMAVPDWPTTEGHWFYPIQLWLGQGWDLFLEHGHRMLAQLVGLLTIALAVVLWRSDRRKWIRWLGIAALAGVIFQGIVGGLRVVGRDVVRWLEDAWTPAVSILGGIGDHVLLKKIHGSTAPLLFGLCAVLVIFTSPRWLEQDRPKEHPAAESTAARRLHRLGLAVTLGVYLMIVLGVQLRHQPTDGGVGGFEVWGWLKFLTVGLVSTWFQLWVLLKLLAAGLLAIGLAWLWIHLRRHFRGQPMLVRRMQLLVGLFCVQLLLAAATWVTNYGWPAWFTENVWAIRYTVVQEGRLQAPTTTLHSALGSLNLVAALSLTVWSYRYHKTLFGRR